MSIDQDQLAEQIYSLLDQFEPDSATETAKLCSYLYVPSPRLPALIEELEMTPSTSATRIQRGRLMEQVAAALFTGLRGWTQIRSYQSAAPQYDLILSGDGARWSTFIKTIFGQVERRALLVEAKATKDKLTEAQMSRVCALVATHLRTVGLVAFVTISGATGFGAKAGRSRSVSDCRLRQLVFYAGTSVPVLVFDLNDLKRIAAGENFIRLLVSRITELAELAGVADGTEAEPEEVEVPPHIAQVLDRE
jgi:hypothetical protein